ncbi:DUF1028 domain-containing protein [Bowmanella dokdonensis]|uniref:DUF1028 domain-containing protein n=1 Tax=Bowmanella dokdonensis TaxID=751969 RepID=A0A939DME8_9ALTE|nr:DUF1028 domain-containing protein [Bowmanella dokdonensis]MBN7825453.1 DUF1028 domain-containing protein [Bowmanella dokdonensis]
MLSTTGRLSVLIILVFVTAFSLPARATWSVIAVDRDTGEIGIAGASCTFDVSGVASIVPGKGAIVVQAASNYFARMEGVKKMQEDSSAETILEAMKADNFSPERQQYGVILLQQNTAPWFIPARKSHHGRVPGLAMTLRYWAISWWMKR